MNKSLVKIYWPNGKVSNVSPGADWLQCAQDVGINIPTGCLGGSCGACEIEINGEIIRACISKITKVKSGIIKMDFAADPYW